MGQISTYLCVILLELERSFLHNPERTIYIALESLLTITNHMLWINGDSGASGSDPGLGMIDGIARTLRTEVSRLSMVTLASEQVKEIEDRTVESVTNIMTRSFTKKIPRERHESEYVEIMGMLHIM